MTHGDVMDSDLSQQGLWYNDLIKYRGTVLHFRTWESKGIKRLHHVVNIAEQRLLTFEEVKLVVGDDGRTLFEHNALRNAVPAKWLQSLHPNTITNAGNALMLNGVNVRDFKAKQFRKLLQQDKETVPCAMDFGRKNTILMCR